MVKLSQIFNVFAILTALMLSAASQALAIEAVQCKVGKKYFGIFVPADSPIPIPRFFLDEEKSWFYVDTQSPWTNWSNHLTEATGTGVYYVFSETGTRNYRKTINMNLDRFSGAFILTVDEDVHSFRENDWVKVSDQYTLRGLCQKIEQKF